MSSLVNLSRNLLDWLIPQSCLLCAAKAQQALCPPCRRELPWLRQACRVCALPLTTGDVCPECLHKTPSFNCCVAAFEFAQPVGGLINQFKHQRNYRNGKVLSEALVERVQSHYMSQRLPEAIVPIPSHWRRLLQRGFNQAVFVGQELQTALSLPLLPCLRRNHATTRQQGMDRKARLKNLQQAFATKPSSSLPRHVALVDDVLTTGATTEAASQVLKNAGIETVDVWVLARTPAPNTKGFA